jgi:hypothetical protein
MGQTHVELLTAGFPEAEEPTTFPYLVIITNQLIQFRSRTV